MNQKEAVYQTVVNVCGVQDVAYVPTKDERAKINMIIVEAFKAGKIPCDTEYSEADLKKYVSGLTSNWLRKDTRLNGGAKYVAKNPGSRAGASDPQLKALRALLTSEGLSDGDKAEIQGHIDIRTAQISEAKMAKSVDFDALPTELATKFRK